MESTLQKQLIIPKFKKCNLGCGNIILEGWVNVDKYNPQADIAADVLDLPFEDDVFEEVVLSHVIEHISWRKHINLLDEMHRVLEQGGKLSIGFPDFMKTSQAFIDNKNGERWTWWVQTLYGTQTEEGQYHVAPVTTEHLSHQLIGVGFNNIQYETDDQGFDVIITCNKTDALPWHNEEGTVYV